MFSITPIKKQNSQLSKARFSGEGATSSHDETVINKPFHLEKTISFLQFEAVEDAFKTLIYDQSFREEIEKAKGVDIVNPLTCGNINEATASGKVEDLAIYELYPQDSESKPLSDEELDHPLFQVSLNPKTLGFRATVTVDCDYPIEKFSSEALKNFMATLA